MKMKLKYNKKFLTVSTLTGDGCTGLITYTFHAPYHVPTILQKITHLGYQYKMTDKARVRLMEFLSDYSR